MVGCIDVYFIDCFVVFEVCKKIGGKFQIGVLVFQEKIGIVFQKDNKLLISVVNVVLKKVQVDGSYKKLLEKYFGEDICCY